MLTAEQVRGARAMLRMEQRQLADAAGVSVETIKRMERATGEAPTNARTATAIQRALENAGVEFTNGDQPGVRMRRQGGEG